MQESHDGAGRCSASGSFTNLPVPASIKEEDCGRDKEPSPEAEYLSARCVLFTYFQGDISTVVDEHFSRALSQSSGYASSANNSNKSARGRYPIYLMISSSSLRACKCTFLKKKCIYYRTLWEGKEDILCITKLYLGLLMKLLAITVLAFQLFFWLLKIPKYK